MNRSKECPSNTGCRMGENVQEATITTGDDGRAAIEWPVDAIVHVVGLTATMPKLVPIPHALRRPETAATCPEVKELRFETGTTIGGIIQDEAGHPVPGVKVDVHAPATEYEGGNYVFTLGSPMTDAQGRWRLDVAPKNLAGVWGRTSHPHFPHQRRDRVARSRQRRRCQEGDCPSPAGSSTVRASRLSGPGPSSGTTSGERTLRPRPPTSKATSRWKTASLVHQSSRSRLRASRPGFRTFGSMNEQRPSNSA